MSEPREPRSIIEAAEQAAAAGNYVDAERLLREAASLQEERLGALHPDLANTLNNLGIVCEMNGNPDDAEQCFRRAVTIATTVMEADHPFVATSRKNLHDFCEARGKPVELTAPPPVVTAKPESVVTAKRESVVTAKPKADVTAKPKADVTAKPEPDATAAVEQPHQSPLFAEPQEPHSPARWRSIRPLAIGVLGPAAMVIVIVAAGRPWVDSTERVMPESADKMDSRREVSAPPPAAVSAQEAPLPIKTTKPAENVPNQASTTPIAALPTVERPTVLKARLCAELDDWLCDPADRPVPPGPLFFYTQVRSASYTRIQHRWYRDNRLQESVELRVDASPKLGFRTYSRHTMTGDSAGSWRVELRSDDGALLHEERFTVH
jgi:tetratricopeptide repeat protein/DUF2914 family protein